MQSPAWSNAIRTISLQNKTIMATYMHIMEASIDVVQLPVVGNIFVDLDLTLKII